MKRIPQLQMIYAGNLSIAVWAYLGADPPILFFHGAGLCGRTWEPIIKQLPLPNTIYAWDARGHGDSDKPLTPGAYAWDGFSQDMFAMIKALNLGMGVWGVGHSGGAAAMVHAELMYPGMFARMVLIDPIIAPDVFFATSQPLADRSRKRVSSFDSFRAAKEHLGRKPPMGLWHPEMLEAYIRYGFSQGEKGILSLKCPGEIEARIYESGGLINLYDHLHKVTTELLLITGAQSYMAPYVREHSKRFPNATFVELEDTGHFIPQEKPDTCARMITRFFEKGATMAAPKDG